REASAGAHLDAGPVEVGGHAVGVERPDVTTLVVRLPAPAQPGGTIEASMPWQLRLPGQADDRTSRSGDSVRLGSFFPILPWEPGVGWAPEPPTSGFAEAATSPTADFVVSVTVPPGLGVLASGVPDGAGRWSAMAVRDFAMSVGRFTIATGTAHAPGPV